MKKTFLLILFLVLSVYCYADIFEQPYRVFPREYKEAFDNEFYPYILDLDSNDTTRNSIAFLDNKGTYFLLMTYRSFTKTEIEKLRNFHMKESGKSLEMGYNPVPLNQGEEWQKH